MKKNILILILLLSAVGIRAQRFFYIASNRLTDKILQSGLQNKSQFVAASPLGSDYIIRTDVDIRPESNSLQLKITLQDSISLKTVFQNNEDYQIGLRNKTSRIYLQTIVRAFLDRNISRLITCAREDRTEAMGKYSKPRKDKT
jgi:hypothetical protein